VKGGWLVGVVGVVVLAYITLNTLRTESVGSRGPAVGERLPPFAMALALSRSDADANIARHADSGAQGARPACSVRGPGILNLCQLVERGPYARRRGAVAETALAFQDERTLAAKAAALAASRPLPREAGA
jgi:hypothetical protein